MKKLIDLWVNSDWPLTQIVILLVMGAGILIYFDYRASLEVVSTPCSPTGYPGRCYNIPQKMCEIIWSKHEVECTEFAQKLSLSPGRLTGPIVFKCQLVHLDKTFSTSRVSNRECNEMHLDLEAWKRSNDFR